MAGKRKIESKVTKKKDRDQLRKRKLDLKKEKEKVKLWSGVLAEVRTVQTEIQDMDTNSNLEDLRLKCEQLRGLNNQWALLDAMIRTYIDAMPAVLEADEGKGNS